MRGRDGLVGMRLTLTDSRYIIGRSQHSFLSASSRHAFLSGLWRSIVI